MAEPDPTRRLVEFCTVVREEGLPVGTGAVADFCRAAALLGPEDLYWAGRATLAPGPEAIEAYDRAFRRFFGTARTPRQRMLRQVQVAVAGTEAEGDAEAGEEDAPVAARASRIELLRRKSFDRCSADELAELARLAAGFPRTLPRRRSRRRRRARDGTLDVPRTLRRALRTAGEPFERRWTERPRVPRRLVLVLDVSGSMASYSRALLVLAHVLLGAAPRTDVFCFGTRLTRVTRALAARDPDEALRLAAEEVADWDGGTRIGESLAQLLRDSASRGAVRGAVVVVCSDGLDVGDPDLLRTQMERLSRLAHRVVWLNPLKQDPRYEPLARGMNAALPYVDAFASGHNLASLEEAARSL